MRLSNRLIISIENAINLDKSKCIIVIDKYTDKACASSKVSTQCSSSRVTQVELNT